MRVTRAPGSTPAWHSLASLVVLAIASVVLPEALSVSPALRGPAEFAASAAAISGVIVWVHLNRRALLTAETSRHRSRRDRGALYAGSRLITSIQEPKPDYGR